MHALFSGGGTGGHLFPAIAIAEEVRRLDPAARITFIGTKDKIEARVVPRHGYDFHTIWISGFRRKVTLSNLLFPLKVVAAIVQSYMLLRKLKPDVVVGTGGYVCGPVVYVASVLGIPTLIQEQNSYPGVTTRLLASKVKEVHLTFEQTKRLISKTANVKVSGNPTRGVLGSVTREEGAKHFNLDSEKLTVLVFGGSLGTTSINAAMEGSLAELSELNVQIIWQTGKQDFERIQTAVGQHEFSQWVQVRKFIEKMEYAYAASDIAVCRAGASTIAELARMGLPALLVPYPFAAADHQTENAKTMVEIGAAILVRDNVLGTELVPKLKELLTDSSQLKKMGEKAKATGTPEAAKTIAEAALGLAKQYRE